MEINKLFSKIKIFKKTKETPKKNPILQIENLYSELIPYDICIEVGENLVIFSDSVIDEIYGLREKIHKITGIILPVIHIVTNEEIAQNEYRIVLCGEIVAKHFTLPQENYVKSEILYNLEKSLKENLDKVISSDLNEKYISHVQAKYSWLVWEISCNTKVQDIREILINLVKQGKTISNIGFVFEQIAYYAHLKNPIAISKNIARKLKSYTWEIETPKNGV